MCCETGDWHLPHLLMGCFPDGGQKGQNAHFLCGLPLKFYVLFGSIFFCNIRGQVSDSSHSDFM